nr:hypothetical protein HK105_002915 [Polyrhizophydium stewartii]
MEEPGQSGSVAKQAERDATDLDDIAQAPWQSEYRREFTWKTPLKSSLVHDVRDEAVQEYQDQRQQREADQPLMHLFGNGNTHPSVPELALKTFNVRAPPDQIYPHTAERGHRIRDFEATVLAASSPRDATTQRPRIINPTEALKQYMLAREQVAKLQASFRSEYQREFIDWTRSLDRIRASSRGSRLNKTLADHTPGADVDGKSAQMADPDLGAGAAERDLPGRDGGELDDAVKPKPGRSIIEELHGMPAAGVTTEQSSAYYEKRHFAAPADSLLDTGGPGPQTQVARERRGAPSPQIVPATWHLAQDVLKRASSRNRSVAGSPPPSATSPGQPPSPDARRVA